MSQKCPNKTCCRQVYYQLIVLILGVIFRSKIHRWTVTPTHFRVEEGCFFFFSTIVIRKMQLCCSLLSEQVSRGGSKIQVGQAETGYGRRVVGSTLRSYIRLLPVECLLYAEGHAERNLTVSTSIRIKLYFITIKNDLLMHDVRLIRAIK